MKHWGVVSSHQNTTNCCIPPAKIITNRLLVWVHIEVEKNGKRKEQNSGKGKKNENVNIVYNEIVIFVELIFERIKFLVYWNFLF